MSKEKTLRTSEETERLTRIRYESTMHVIGTAELRK